MLHLRAVPKVRVRKMFVCFVFVCIFIFTLTGCRNNLVNPWENYTGDTNVYYQPSSENEEGTTTEVTTAEVTEDPLSLAAYGLPEYWKDELWSATWEALDAMTAAGENRTTFLWYNDSHLSYSSRRSVSILTFLQEQTNISVVNFGGDIVSDYDEVEHSEIISQLYEWREASLSLLNHHSVVGNHDDDIEEFAERDDLYAFLLENEEGKTSADNNPFCYYVDDPAECTRYIYLSTGFDATTADDIAFLVEALNTTLADWHIVVVSHIWFSYYDTLTPTVGEVPEFAQIIFEILDDYNARETGYEREVEYDFTSAEAKVEFCIGGHTHVDFDFYTDGGIPVILTETDSYHLRGGDKDLDETNESSVSVIIADYQANILHIIRAGRGENRTVLLSNT